MNLQRETKITEYFGARNGFSGFQSNFVKIFNPDDFERIFILKGGPGTGKSSLMKKIAAFGTDRNYTVEKIYCSSDPGSLDGVILQGRASIAVIDGTAPHMTDPIYPGAKEEIINLGDSFITEKLISAQERITRLGKAKKAAFSEAYDALNLCGRIFDYIIDKIKKDWIYNLAEIKSVSFLNKFGIKEGSYTPKERIISSFGKNGLIKIDNSSSESKKVSINGDKFLCCIFMSILCSKLVSCKAALFVCPSALSDLIIDRVYTDDLMICVNEDAAIQFDLSDMTPGQIVGYDELVRSYEDTLSIASAHFKTAAENHFLLEDIYKDAVDFSHNDIILNSLNNKIGKILC